MRTLKSGRAEREEDTTIMGLIVSEEPKRGWFLQPFTLERKIPMLQQNSLECVGHGVRYDFKRDLHRGIPLIAMEIDSVMNTLLLEIETTGHI